MTVEKVSIKPRRIELTADGVLTDFDFDFKIFAEGDVTVYIRDLSDVSVLQTITTEYTVAFNSENETGTISFLTPPTDMFIVLMISNSAYEQQTDIPKGGGFSEPVVEKGYDLLAIQIQQLREDLDRAVTLSETSPLTSAELPDPAVADAPIGWDPTGTFLVNNPASTNLSQIDTGATPDFIGASSGDGVIRTSGLLTYVDGGDFITIGITDALIDHDTILNNHNLTTDIDHDTILNNHNLTTDIDHDAILNFVADEHVAHTGVTLTAGEGLAGGGDISANRTFDVDIASATGATVASLDEVLIADVDDSDNIRKVTAQSIADLGAGGGPIEVFDEGGSLTATASSFDFVGAGVVATNVGSAITVTIAGGGGYTDPLTTRGDVLVRDASNVTNRLAIGANTFVLTSDGTDVSWAAASGGSALEVEDEGISLSTAVTLFNFVGAGVTVTEPVANEMLVTIAGSAADTYTETFVDGDLTAGSIAITHSLNDQYPLVQIYDNSDNLIIPDEVTATSVSVSTLDLSGYGTLVGTYRVVISASGSSTVNPSFVQSFVDADLTAGVLTVAHSLNQQYCQVQIFNNNDDLIQPDDVTLTDANNLDVDISGFGTITGTWRVVVISAGGSVSSTATDLSLAGQTTGDIASFDGANWVAGAPTVPASDAAFLVGKSTAQLNLATTGTADITFDTEVFDLGNDFASNTFTAPVTGKYKFDLYIRMDNWDTAVSNYQMHFTTSNRSYSLVRSALDLSGDAINSLAFSILADMDAGDTCIARIAQAGGTSQTDIAAGADSRFSGFLVV
jgi:hypothetical protein